MINISPQVRVWSRRLTSAEKCANAIGGKAFDSVEAAVKDADIIITVSAATEPILMKEWVKPGAHINGEKRDFEYTIGRKNHVRQREKRPVNFSH